MRVEEDLNTWVGRPTEYVEAWLAEYTQLRHDSRVSANQRGPMLTFATPPSWMREPFCAGRWEEFDRAGSARRAAALCAGCPIIDRCLSEALEEERDLVAHARWGVRGGLNPEGRVQAGAKRFAVEELPAPPKRRRATAA